MLNIEDDIEDNTLDDYGYKYNKYIIQLYKALNRQYNKENAIRVIINFIYKRFGYRTMYLDVVEDKKMIILKDLNYKYADNDNAKDQSRSGICNVETSMDKYKELMYFKDQADIREVYPKLEETFEPKVLLSTPVFSQNRLIGTLIIYDIYKREIPSKFKDLAKLISQELTAVFCRIEKQNLKFESMLGLTAIENILLYNTDNTENNISNNPIKKIISELSNVTGMKRSTLALLDEEEKFLLPQCSSVAEGFIVDENKYSLNKSENKDHTAIIAIETKEPVIVYDALTDPRCDKELVKKLGIYSSITLPILDIHGKPLGVINLDNGEYENFSMGQIRFLKIVARHIGLIISNIEYIGDLKTWSKYDGLTGLINRRAFENIYKEVHDTYKSSKEEFSILMIDIDDFKSTNDIYGHQVGDEVLKGVADCIERNIRKKDIAARYGGEEIIVILKNIGKIKAEIIANRIRHSISNLSVNGVSVTVSIGVSTFAIDSYNKDNLIYIADKCLYEAKNIGKNQVVCK